MPDIYRSFEELKRAEAAEAYRITAIHEGRSARIAIIAPHGGGIEPMTSILAREIAGDDFALYLFEGRLGEGNNRLHITSHRFDEPNGLDLVGKCDSVIAVHGCSDAVSEKVLLGGLDRTLRTRLGKSLDSTGFATAEAPANLQALDISNICNRGKTGAGVQLELPAGMRQSLKGDKKQRQRFVDAIRAVILLADGE